MNKQNNQNVTPDCPDIELLSAWFDGEEILTDMQKEHIKHCSACAKRLADYKGICTGMKKGFTCQDLNAEVTERILSQTHCMIRQQINTVCLEAQAKMRRRIIWGIRIALLLVAIVGFIILMVREKKTSRPVPAKQNTSVTIKGPAFSAFRVPKQLRSYRTSDVFSSSASPVELNLDGSMFCVFDGENHFVLHAPVCILPRTLQYWHCTSFNAKQLEGHLEHLKKELGIEKLDILTSDKSGTYPLEMMFQGNVRQLAVLIKQMRVWGMNQLSFSAPRHDQYFFFGDGENNVRCRFFVFIPQDGGKYILPVM